MSLFKCEEYIVYDSDYGRSFMRMRFTDLVGVQCEVFVSGSSITKGHG